MYLCILISPGRGSLGPLVVWFVHHSSNETSTDIIIHIIINDKIQCQPLLPCQVLTDFNLRCSVDTQIIESPAFNV